MRENQQLYGVRPEAMEADYPQPSYKVTAPYLGKSGILNYFLPAGLMHPEDAKRYLSPESKGGGICQCVREENEWVVLRCPGGEEYRVNPQRLIWVPTPKFVVGDKVITKVGTSRIGWIRLLEWHLKQKNYKYYIEIPIVGEERRKRHTRRYSEDELDVYSQTQS